MRKTLFVMFVLSLIGACGVYAGEGLDNLIAIARNQGEIQREFAGRTKNYNAIKAAYDNGAISKGKAKEDIEKRYGGPDVIIDASAGKREKWIYKPASASFFGGERIALYFNDSGGLDEIVFQPEIKKEEKEKR